MSKSENCVIEQFNALRSLTDKELSRFKDVKVDSEFKKGAAVFKEGETLSGVYVIKKGICKLTKLNSSGRVHIVKLVVEGDLLGQRSLMSDEPTNLTAEALNDLTVSFIPKLEIVNYIKSNPYFSLDIIKKLSNRLRESDNGIVNMAQKSVKQRLAETLLYVKESFGENENGMLNVVLTREEYANIIGTATAVVIRLLSQFKQDNLISAVGKQIKIENINALREIS